MAKNLSKNPPVAPKGFRTAAVSMTAALMGQPITTAVVRDVLSMGVVRKTG
jgi:hypothetical protein